MIGGNSFLERRHGVGDGKEFEILLSEHGCSRIFHGPTTTRSEAAGRSAQNDNLERGHCLPSAKRLDSIRFSWA